MSKTAGSRSWCLVVSSRSNPPVHAVQGRRPVKTSFLAAAATAGAISGALTDVGINDQEAKLQAALSALKSAGEA